MTNILSMHSQVEKSRMLRRNDVDCSTELNVRFCNVLTVIFDWTIKLVCGTERSTPMIPKTLWAR